ncbi:MAG: glycosyltransferase family 2 protein [bacterium]|nr:glycosyltransferase family 2 protein [bacterium]
MRLSIVIPVYNEKNTIRKILERINNVNIPGVEKEIILIDDCSTDGTREILEGLKHTYRVIFNDKNEGKGSSVKAGFAASTGDILIIQDADLEYDPKEYQDLIQPILDGEADAVMGSRFLGAGAHRVLYFRHYIGNRVLTMLSNLFTNLNLTDVYACYKVFNRKAISQFRDEITAHRFGIEPELVALAAAHKLRVYEVGISYHGRTYEEGKKIGWADGIAALWWIVRYGLFK